MCLSRAYWAGIRRIVFVVNKEKVDSKICYESDINQKELVTKFNEKIEVINIKDLEEDALNTYSEWLSNQ